MRTNQGVMMLRFLAVVCALMLLGGCTSAIPYRTESESTLPPVALEFTAPLGDAGESINQGVLLSLPSAAHGGLEYFSERVLVPFNRHPAEYALRRLLTYTGTTQADPLSKTTTLSINPGSTVEISGNTATVNLAPSALSLTNKERYLAARAITNTLSQWGDLRFVNLLINSRQPGLDTAATLPMGSLSRTADVSVDEQWDAINRAAANTAGPFSAQATIYYPVSAGRGVLAQSRPITARSKSMSDLTYALLEALSLSETGLENTQAVPNLIPLLASDILVEESPGSTGRVVRLHFHENLNEELIAAGVPRSVMMAALTYTLTTFLPYTAGITVTIGNEPIAALVPSGIFEGAGEQILFENNVMQRGQFQRFLLNNVSLYFMNAQGSLTTSLRPIPAHQADNPRYLLGQLMAGPEATDSVPGLANVMPQDLRDSDILGINRVNDTVLVNFSDRLTQLTEGFTAQQEMLMVYAMVNTLTQKPHTRQAAFFINGIQPTSKPGDLDYAGVFLRNEGIIR